MFSGKLWKITVGYLHMQHKYQGAYTKKRHILLLLLLLLLSIL